MHPMLYNLYMGIYAICRASPSSYSRVHYQTKVQRRMVHQLLYLGDILGVLQRVDPLAEHTLEDARHGEQYLWLEVNRV